MKKSLKTAIRAEFRSIDVPGAPLTGHEDTRLSPAASSEPRYFRQRRLRLAVNIAGVSLFTLVIASVVLIQFGVPGFGISGPTESEVSAAIAMPSLEPSLVPTLQPTGKIPAITQEYIEGVGVRKIYNMPIQYQWNGWALLESDGLWYAEKGGTITCLGELLRVEDTIQYRGVDYAIQFGYQVLDGMIIVLEDHWVVNASGLLYNIPLGNNRSHVWLEICIDGARSSALLLYNPITGDYRDIAVAAGLSKVDGNTYYQYSQDFKTALLKTEDDVYVIDIETGLVTSMDFPNRKAKKISFLDNETLMIEYITIEIPSETSTMDEMSIVSELYTYDLNTKETKFIRENIQGDINLDWLQHGRYYLREKKGKYIVEDFKTGESIPIEGLLADEDYIEYSNDHEIVFTQWIETENGSMYNILAIYDFDTKTLKRFDPEIRHWVMGQRMHGGVLEINGLPVEYGEVTDTQYTITYDFKK